MVKRLNGNVSPATHVKGPEVFSHVVPGCCAQPWENYGIFRHLEYRLCKVDDGVIPGLKWTFGGQ